ncbi:substrate-binding periplasmic protein [Curvivirga aplysinae]|uniref:substrate-binding periplasmic protein n=1 Tax=Curvivirga aplysinae TaxID=2529852 RepID=UPI0012BD4D7A|nr:transporter substrate-binding domain-containing protein [Curvivirga aplysinae]MTI09427.1 transporter substrate-binding domain-containing protein [Curvivirga aplysinae]
MGNLHSLKSILQLSLLNIILSFSVFFPTTVKASCSEITISGHPNYPPYQWNHQGQIIGASIDIARKILEEKDIKVHTPYVGAWKRVLRSAEHGTIDMIVALKRTSERQVYLTFNDTPFYINPFVIWVKKGRSFNFTEWSDLIGKQGGKNLGDRYGDDFDKFIKNNLSITPVNSVASNFKLLALERHDYYIHGLYPGRSYLLVNDLEQDFTALTKKINEGFIHNAFSKKSPCIYLNDFFNKRLKEMMNNGDTKSAMDQNLKLWQKLGKLER